MHLIDTCICIDILRGSSPQVPARFRAAMDSGVAVSSITAAELHHGLARGNRSERNRRGLENFLGSVRVLPFGEKAAEAYGIVRYYLEHRGNVIGPYDLLIAAHAIAENAVLVTSNTREFKRVPTLELSDWR
ncbi:MAG: type II toxin-antitoxin system tRNA(fMet)-specific endonuclease VapC [Gemmatimonadaceae bacterium]